MNVQIALIGSLLLLPLCLIGQDTQKIDSLLLELQAKRDQTEIVQIASQLWAAYINSDPREALVYADQIIQIGEELYSAGPVGRDDMKEFLDADSNVLLVVDNRSKYFKEKVVANGPGDERDQKILSTRQGMEKKAYLYKSQLQKLHPVLQANG